jgi:hydrogenase large subunit
VSRLILGPFNRVEGDLEVQLEVQEGRVRSARVNAPLYRGFENMLTGREPMDALTIVPRICGICSVSQSVAAAKALADVAGVTPPPNGQLAINLMLACENLADHLTHFYVFFMPDFTRPVYAKRDWFTQANKRFAAVSGTGGGGNGGGGEGSRALLAARARWFALMGTLGGKWPHTGSVLPGGSSRALEPNEVLRMRARVREMRQFLESTLFGTSLEAFTELGTLPALQSWQTQAAGSDLALFLDITQNAQLNNMGTGSTRFLSYGAYTNAIGSDGDHGFAQGVWTADTATLSKLKASEITEDPRHAWLTETQGALHPTHGVTQPLLDKPGAYTWNKAPRLNGAVMETGAIARQLVDGQALVRAAVAAHGASVGTRVLARLMEVALIVPLMEQWLGQLQAREPFHTPYQRPANGQGVGLSEAARGALGHWLRIEHGKLSSYQIVAPTSWNFSPRDSAGVPGALEAALVDTAVGQEGEAASESVAVQHIVRSFDPCMVCTVH